MRARGSVMSSVTVNGWALDLDDPIDAQLYALAHSPVLRRWPEYPAPMRDAWRTRFGSGWAIHMLLPPALEPLETELTPALAPEPVRQLPDRDVRPPDVPPAPALPPASPQLRPRRMARAGGVPF